MLRWNLGLCAGLVAPVLLLFLYKGLSSLLGDRVTLIGAFALLVLLIFSEGAYVLVPILFLSGIGLLVVPGIPPRVKIPLIFIEFVLCCYYVWLRLSS